MWGLFGYGLGMLELPARAVRTDLGLAMAAFGARGELLAPAAAGLGLAVWADGLVGRSWTAGLAAAAEVTRLRLLLEGTHGGLAGSAARCGRRWRWRCGTKAATGRRGWAWWWAAG